MAVGASCNDDLEAVTAAVIEAESGGGGFQVLQTDCCTSAGAQGDNDSITYLPPEAVYRELQCSYPTYLRSSVVLGNVQDVFSIVSGSGRFLIVSSALSRARARFLYVSVARSSRSWRLARSTARLGPTNTTSTARAGRHALRNFATTWRKSVPDSK